MVGGRWLIKTCPIIILLFVCVVGYVWYDTQKPRAYKLTGLVRRDGKIQVIDLWVKIERDQDRRSMWRSVEWSPTKFEDCKEIDPEAHYKTYHPMAGLKGPNGELATITDLRSMPMQKHEPANDGPLLQLHWRKPRPDHSSICDYRRIQWLVCRRYGEPNCSRGHIQPHVELACELLA
jgi:hypothetical protein